MTFDRRFFIPEVVQTSAMDCGPAALTSLLGGAGIDVSYARLRDACQTRVDGTSIDVLEEVANALGLVAEQTIVPVDHLLTPVVDALPAIVVMRASNGLTHFVVAWRRHGNLIQLMDPAVGRRFVTVQRFLAELYCHRITLPVAQALPWIGGDEFRGVLAAKLRALGVDVDGEGAALLHVDAAATPKEVLTRMAALDASVRAVDELVRARALRRGDEAQRALTAVLAQAIADPTSLPRASYVIAFAPDDDDAVVIDGAVCLRACGRRATTPEGHEASDGNTASSTASSPARALPAALCAAHERERPLATLLRIVRAAGARAPLLVGLGVIAAVVGGALEALLFRGLFDLARDLGNLPQRVGAIALVVAWAAGLTLLDASLRLQVRRCGRLVEGAVRVAFLEKIPRLRDRYLSSRPASDMAQRAHALHRLRAIPELAVDAARTCAALVVTAAGLVWLDPAGLPFVLVALALVVVVPLACMPVLTEQDLRVRVHGGALFQFLLDGLLGLVAVRAHAAERALRREHEALLVEWVKAARAALRTGVAVTVLQGLASIAVVATLVVSYLGRAGESGGVLLFVYWALQLPALGGELLMIVRQAPQLRNVTLRMLEPLGAAGDLDASPVPAPATAPQGAPAGVGAHIELDHVTVRAGGHTVLDDVSVTIPAGAHVAIVGPSGAGKSSLVGLLLGWHEASEGVVLVDGQPLDVEALRAETAWLDPAVQLWGRSLLDNLQYGAPASNVGDTAPIDRVLDDAELSSLLSRLPEGLNTQLGEGGGLLSGGEGQRVRFGRALMRDAPRLVILDEPFRGLDRERRDALLARARVRFAGATLVCVTHDIEETAGFDRVLVVDGGRIVEDGSPAALGGALDAAPSATSTYRALLDAERALREQLWADPGWTRLRLDGPARKVECSAARSAA
jgi:ABC-type bacteriocin/lantibiotic exporter with double-glycine peptidase domain